MRWWMGCGEWASCGPWVGYGRAVGHGQAVAHGWFTCDGWAGGDGWSYHWWDDISDLIISLIKCQIIDVIMLLMWSFIWYDYITSITCNSLIIAGINFHILFSVCVTLNDHFSSKGNDYLYSEGKYQFLICWKWSNFRTEIFKSFIILAFRHE